MSDEKQDELDPGFRVVDKRQGAASEGGGQANGQAADEHPAGAPADTGRRPAAEPAEEGEQAPELESIDVYGVVQYCVALLNGHAWQWMGLVMNPVTKTVERDLTQARVAIDCIEALLKQSQAGMPEAQARQLQQALNDLRINFVRQGAQSA
jgi:hypothetical protein